MSVSSQHSIFRQWHFTGDTQSVWLRKLTHLWAFVLLVRYSSDLQSLMLLMRLIAERIAVAFHLYAVDQISTPQQVYTVRLRGLYISFIYLEDLLTWYEIFVDAAYEQSAGFRPQPTWTVFDVGANTGIFSLRVGQICKAVLAFEPNAKAYALLEKNVRQNRFTGIVTEPYALGDRNIAGYLGESTVFTTGARVFEQPEGPDGNDSQMVKIITLDEYIAQHDLAYIDLLKIDVEGFETKVIRGAKSSLNRICRIVLEYHEMFEPGVLAEVTSILTQAKFRMTHKVEYSGNAVGLAFFENQVLIAGK